MNNPQVAPAEKPPAVSEEELLHALPYLRREIVLVAHGEVTLVVQEGIIVRVRGVTNRNIPRRVDKTKPSGLK